MNKVHFIAIGGAVMHNLAIALHKKGYQVSGSDDEIFEPSKSRLAAYNLLPEKQGWSIENIQPDLDAVILGMHARIDNPELQRAKELGLKIYSFPEFLYEQTREKLRIAVGGSHGKTTTTSMLMHVFKEQKLNFDYMVGSIIEGFETMVGFDEDSKIAVFEGDEYLSSPIDLRPKFHLYQPKIAVITGIAWDHINVFPSWGEYKEQFGIFIDKIEPGGCLIYFKGDETIKELLAERRPDIDYIPYEALPSRIEAGNTIVRYKGSDYPLKIFGEHNLQNMSAALEVSKRIGVMENDFFKHIKSFKGAAKRLQSLKETNNATVFLDFAHAPSKLRATLDAVKMQHPDRQLTACFELHTFSSLNRDFIHQYQGTMDAADEALVYFDPNVLKHKKLPDLDAQTVADAFGRSDLIVFTDKEKMLKQLNQTNWEKRDLLIMSSGNFSGINFRELADQLLK